MTFLIVLHIIICFALVGIILLQPGKSDMGIGFGSSSQSIFGSKGASNFLTKTTSICVVIFLVTSFTLTKLRISEAERSVIKGDAPAAGDTSPGQPGTPTQPGAPASNAPAGGAPAGQAPATGGAKPSGGK